MTRYLRLALAFVYVAIGGCGRPHSPEAATSADRNAPPPFSAEQIRDATRVGRMYTFRIESADQSLGLQKIKFADVRDDGCRIEVTMFDDNLDMVGEKQTSDVTWEELVAHATYPKEATEITDVAIDLPIGHRECLLYTVTEDRDGVSSITRAWFAKDLPRCARKT